MSRHQIIPLTATVLTRIVQSIPLLYLAMLAPGYLAFWDLYAREWYFAHMMYLSGVLSLQLLILTLSVTPALLLINRMGYGKALGRWLLVRRRHFGLGSAIYAALHTAHYVLYTVEPAVIWFEAFNLAYGTGWIALLIFVPLSLTSNRWSQRRLGAGWKRLHLMVYPATALVIWHWYLLDFHPSRWMYWAALAALPKLLHISLRYGRRLRLA